MCTNIKALVQEVFVKRWIFILFVSIILSACSGDSDGTDTSANNTEKATMTWDQDNWNDKNWE